MMSLEDTLNYDADIVGVTQDGDVTYYVIKDHILWVDGLAELCWSINDLYWNKNGVPMMDPILYQTSFDRFFQEWLMVFPVGTIVIEQE